MQAALIHPAVPPPTMTTRNGCYRLLFRVASLIELPPGKGAPSREFTTAHLHCQLTTSTEYTHSLARISELDADTKLVTSINPGPARILENRSGSRGCRRITK